MGSKGRGRRWYTWVFSVSPPCPSQHLTALCMLLPTSRCCGGSSGSLWVAGEKVEELGLQRKCFTQNQAEQFDHMLC